MVDNIIEMNESVNTIDGWSDDIELILNNLLDNCNKLQQEHKSQFIKMESILKFFNKYKTFFNIVQNE